jgi:hypothetical protein
LSHFLKTNPEPSFPDIKTKLIESLIPHKLLVVFLYGLLELLGIEDISLILRLGKAGNRLNELLSEQVVVRRFVTNVDRPNKVLLISFQCLCLKIRYFAFTQRGVL